VPNPQAEPSTKPEGRLNPGSVPPAITHVRTLGARSVVRSTRHAEQELGDFAGCGCQFGTRAIEAGDPQGSPDRRPSGCARKELERLRPPRLDPVVPPGPQHRRGIHL